MKSKYIFNHKKIVDMQTLKVKAEDRKRKPNMDIYFFSILEIVTEA